MIFQGNEKSMNNCTLSSFLGDDDAFGIKLQDSQARRMIPPIANLLLAVYIHMNGFTDTLAAFLILQSLPFLKQDSFFKEGRFPQEKHTKLNLNPTLLRNYFDRDLPHPTTRACCAQIVCDLPGVIAHSDLIPCPTPSQGKLALKATKSKSGLDPLNQDR